MIDNSSEKIYKGSLVKKFTAIFSVFILLFLVFSAAMLYILQSEIYEYVIDFQKYKVTEEAERINDFTKDIIIDLKSFYVLKEDVLNNDFSLTTTHIYQLFLVNKSIDAVKIISPAGDELLAVSRFGITPKKQLGSVKDAQYFQQAKNDIIFYGEPRLEGKNVYADIAVPYFENFNLTAVVWARINFSPFFSELTSEITFNEGHLHILDKNGIVLSALDINLIGFDSSKMVLFEELKNKKEVFGIECLPCVEEHEFDIIASAKRVDAEQEFILALESDEKKVFELYYQFRNIAIMGLVVFIVFSAIFIFIIRLRTQKYLKILVEGVRKIHEGKYGEKIVLETGDELEYFAEHLNHFSSDLEQKIGKLREVDIIKYNFIKAVSHQLRTPISSMMWLTEALMGQMAGKFTSEQNDIFRDIYKANKNISQIINDMILMADVDDDKIVLEKSTANCDDIIGSVMFEVQEQSRQKNISINSKKPENPLPLCEGDVKKIKFILYRLLDNAVKYSEEGKDIAITVKVSNEGITFIIQDFGIGIPKDEQPRIFIKFYRATSAYKMVQDASGLSLYICKYFAELHGGKIWFESKEGEGSTFYFFLPALSTNKISKTD